MTQLLTMMSVELSIMVFLYIGKYIYFSGGGGGHETSSIKYYLCRGDLKILQILGRCNLPKRTDTY